MATRQLFPLSITRARALCVAFALGAVSTGCTLDQAPPADTSSAPPAVVQNATEAPPTFTPIPTIPPTPTIPPADILRAAERHLHNGLYQDAILTYQAVLRQNAPPDDQAAAYAGIGKAALREGLFADAVSHFTTLIDRFPDSPYAAEARFQRGDALLGVDEWAAAIADFEAYMTARPGLLDSYALERIADAQVALGQTDTAIETYVRAAAASRGLIPSLALRERVAQVLLNARRPADAVAQYDAILAIAQNAPYRADIGLRAARILLENGETAAALDRLTAIIAAAPETQPGYQAIRLLIANGGTVDAYLEGRSAFAVGEFQAAVDALNRWSSTRASVGEIPAQFHLTLGQAYRAIGNTEAAVTAFQTIIDTYTRDPLFGAALLEQGRTRFLAGDIPGAIGRYMQIVERYGYLPEAAEALWRAAYLYSTNDQIAEGNTLFERLADAYPNTEQAISGLFLAGANAWRAGNFDAAERYYAELATKTTGEQRATAYFWLGRAALNRGEAARASQAFTQTIADAPDSYFAARARDLVSGVPPFTPPAAWRFTFDDAAEVAAAESWLRATFSIAEEGALWMLPPALAQDARWVRGSALWAVGAVDEANAELGDLVEAYRADPLASYRLAIALRGIGAYYNSIIAASYVIRAANIGTLDAPGFIARMRYPVYYLELVQSEAARYQFDPLLLFALIRHESLFNTYATAAAGEIGLTQVVPGTAAYIAQQIAFPDYQHSDLFRPYAGIAFGAFYLNEQLDRFDQNAIAALAGYNAGPGRAIDWLRLSGGDPDQFMTAISISSTRTYVERIYSHHTIYRALYGGT
jgi:soluble lytic murein transglycosylase